MSALQRSALTKSVTKNCDNCGEEYYAIRRRYCSKECRTAVDKGGKTYDEKRLDVIAKCNERWLNKETPRRVKIDPKHINMTTY